MLDSTGSSIPNLLRCLLLCGLLTLTAPLLMAEETAESSSLEDEAPLYEISLLTFSPGDGLFEWFGHTGLAVTERRTGDSTAYNFGGFSFGTDDLLMFTMGKFVFWSYWEKTSSMIRRYRAKQRHIIVQTLDLTREQTTHIRQNLIRETLPQYQFYVYDHFKDNCATRLRDIVDDGLSGAIRKQASDNTSHTTRDLVHRMTAHLPALNFLVNFVLADGVDRNITYWETMFLPDRLMAVFGSSVNPATGRPLIKERSEIIKKDRSPFLKETVKIPDTSTRERTLGLALGVLMALCAWFYLRTDSHRGLPASLLKKLYPTFTVLYGAVFGTLGIALFFMAVIASHKDVYWNENVFLLNPVTFLLLPLGILRLCGRARRIFNAVCLFCALSAAAAVCLKLLPAFDQQNAQQIRILLPITIVIGITALLDLRGTSR